MIYTIKLIDDTVVTYDTVLNDLFIDGIPLRIFLDNNVGTCNNADNINIRLVLGYDCNFNCKYCSQGSLKNIKISKSLSVEKIVYNIIRLVPKGKLQNITYWGGEPFVYFEAMSKFTSLIRNAYSNVSFGLATNGSFLKEPYISWVFDNKIGVSLSYDGMNQSIRGDDISKDIEIKSNVQKLSSLKLLSFLYTISDINQTVSSYIENVKAAFGIDKVYIPEHRLAYNTGGESTPILFSEEDVKTYCKHKYADIFNYDFTQVHSIDEKILTFVNNLGKELDFRRSCPGTMDNNIIVDMAGNILTCHNYNSEYIDTDTNESFLLGNISTVKSLKDIPNKINNKQNKHTEYLSCNECLVKHFCNSGCPYTLREKSLYNCTTNYYQYLPVLLKLITLHTQKMVKSVSPSGPPKNIIPLFSLL